ncbi:MAG: hypothetical protein WCS20_02575 [Alphaproteobacteria bacterium]
MKSWHLMVAALALTGCSDLPDALKAPSARPIPAPPMALPLPPADGRAADITIGDGRTFLVLYRQIDQARGGVALRITRQGLPELTYSDGLLAKRVAVAFCDQFNRPLNQITGGKFSQPNAWVFEGGCQ